MEKVPEQKPEEVIELNGLPESVQKWFFSRADFVKTNAAIVSAMLNNLETFLRDNMPNDSTEQEQKLNLTSLALLYSAFQSRLGRYNQIGEEVIKSESLTEDVEENILKAKNLMKQIAKAKSFFLSKVPSKATHEAPKVHPKPPKTPKTHNEVPSKASPKAPKTHNETYRETHHKAPHKAPSEKVPLNISQESELIATQTKHILVDSHLRTFGTLSANNLMTREQFDEWVLHAEKILFGPPKP